MTWQCVRAQKLTHLDVICHPELVTPMSATHQRHPTAIAVCAIHSQGSDLGSQLGSCQQGHLVEETRVLPLLIMLHYGHCAIPAAHYDVPCRGHGHRCYALLDQPLSWATVAQQTPLQVDLQQAQQQSVGLGIPSDNALLATLLERLLVMGNSGVQEPAFESCWGSDHISTVPGVGPDACAVQVWEGKVVRGSRAEGDSNMQVRAC